MLQPTAVPRDILTVPLQTALQVYSKHYKQAHIGNTHGLLRKAQRLDTILNTEDSDASESSRAFPDPQCTRCRTEFSPSFYPTPPSTPPRDGEGERDGGRTPSSAAQAWLCHRCHFQEEHGGASVHVGVNGANGVNGSATNGILAS